MHATVDGGSNTLLVDTGSSGLVIIPWQSLDSSNVLQAFEDLFKLGSPSGIGESSYGGGDYIYLTYNHVDVGYGNGALTEPGTPVDVEIFSWPTSAGSPASFQDFLADDDVTGILGLGGSDGAGPTESPLQAVGFTGATVFLPADLLVVGHTNETQPIYIDYTNDTTTFDLPTKGVY